MNTPAVRLLLALSVLVALPGINGCSRQSMSEITGSVEVGRHRFEFAMPKGWHRRDRPDTHGLRTEKSSISFTDLGPCTPEGYRRTLIEAREHYRAGRSAEARALAKQLSLKKLVPDEKRWSSFTAAWTRVRHPGRPDFADAPEEIESAYEQLLNQVATLTPQPLEELAGEVIEDLSQNGMQETADSNAIEVDGRPAQVIDTWDHLTHTMRRRYLFLIHDNNLFFVRTDFGEFSEVEAAFPQLTGSIRFLDAVE